MKEVKIYQLVLLAAISVLYMSSCSTTTDLPYDDVYYSAKKNSGTTVSKSGNLSNDVYESSASTGDYNSYYNGEASSEATVPVGEGAYGNETTSSDDIYYDSDYESRIKRFGNESNSDLGYYDEYYTGNDCNCGSSNWNVSVGVGVGWGWSMGYGYGWPHYGWPYYSPYYPYYGYGYGGGYSHGYWNGYWDGYYGYPPYYGGGGYYPDYGYGYTAQYGPRGSRTGGTNIPNGSSRGSVASSTNPTYRGQTVVAGGGGYVTNLADASGGSHPGGGTSGNVRPAESVRVNPETSKVVPVSSQTKAAVDKPISQQRSVSQSSRTKQEYSKPKQSTRGTVSQKPKYDKPKSYRTLPAQQPRTSKEYNAPQRTQPTTRAQQSNTNNSRQRVDNRKPVNQPNTRYNRTNTSRSNVNRSTTTNTRSATSNSNVRRSTSSRPSTSTTSPSRKKSSSSSKSYSSPSKSYSSPSRSYSSPSRSSSSSSSSRSSGSSGSSSRSSGGGRR